MAAKNVVAVATAEAVAEVAETVAEILATEGLGMAAKNVVVDEAAAVRGCSYIQGVPKKLCIATFLPPGQYIRQQQPKDN